MRKIIYILLFILFSCQGYSQRLLKTKSADKAAIYSAILPGAGQVYTKKYWKVPIIYSGLITSAYFIESSQNKYILYKTTAINRINGDFTDNLDYSDDDLIRLKDHYRRNRDLSYFSFIAIYILNIVDASVNAHLFEYDISDDISMNLQPNIKSDEIAMSLTLTF